MQVRKPFVTGVSTAIESGNNRYPRERYWLQRLCSLGSSSRESLRIIVSYAGENERALQTYDQHQTESGSQVMLEWRECRNPCCRERAWGESMRRRARRSYCRREARAPGWGRAGGACGGTMDQMYDLEVMERESKREGLHRGGAAPRELRVRNATLGRRGLGLVGAVSPVWVIVMHGSLSSSAPTSVCLPAEIGRASCRERVS